MKRAAAILRSRRTYRGVIARRLSVPAVVGCGDATRHTANANE